MPITKVSKPLYELPTLNEVSNGTVTEGFGHVGIDAPIDTDYTLNVSGGIKAGDRLDVYGPSGEEFIIDHTSPEYPNAVELRSTKSLAFVINNQERMTLSSGGDVHITGNLEVDGNITAFASSSDERLKEDITTMPVGLIDDIAPVKFKWKKNEKVSGGVIAQQLQEVGLGDFVHEAPNGDLGVDYNALIGILLAEVIELKKKVV